MERSKDFDNCDYLQVFGALPQKPKSLLDFWGVGRTLVLVSVAASCLIFVGSLLTQAMTEDTCIRSHMIRTSDGQELSLPHQKDKEGCIVDFDQSTKFGL